MKKIVCLLAAALLSLPGVSAIAASKEDVATVVKMVRELPERRDTFVGGLGKERYAASEITFNHHDHQYIVIVSNADSGIEQPTILIRSVSTNRRTPVLLEDQGLDGVLDRGLNYYDGADFRRELVSKEDRDQWDEWYDVAIQAAVSYRETVESYHRSPP